MTEIKDHKGIEDNSSDEDEWYNKMEQASYLMDDDVIKDSELDLKEKNSLNINNSSEEDYFNNLVEYNFNNNNSIIMSEQHPIWNNILKSIATSTTATSTTSSLPMTPIVNTDYSSLVLIKNWLFNYLPKTSKLYVQVSNMLIDTKNILNQYLYIDDLLHISLIILFKIKHEDKIVDVSFYTPHIIANDHTLQTIDSIIYSFTTNYMNYNIILSSIETNFYESNIMKCKHWNISWVEYCGLYILEGGFHPHSVVRSSTTNNDTTTNATNNTTISTTNTTKSSNINTSSDMLMNILPCNYIYCELREADADIVNDTWKYKSTGSLSMIKAMIATYPCYGIRYKQPTINNNNDNNHSSSSNSLLVSWCLTYEYGAIGMLYTIENHRGKGLARAIVIHLLHNTKLKLLQQPHSNNISSSFNNNNNNSNINNNTSSNNNNVSNNSNNISYSTNNITYLSHPSFAYIEQSNNTSKQLFTSLGFMKCDDALWAEISFTPKFSK